MNFTLDKRTWLKRMSTTYVGTCPQCGEPMLLGDGRDKCLACTSPISALTGAKPTRLGLKREYLKREANGDN